MKRLILSAGFLLLATQGWGAYSYYRTVTVNAVDVSTYQATYSNFPVLVSTYDITLTTQSTGGHLANASGYDMAFGTDQNCNFLLNWDTETINNVGVSTMNVWVNIPTVSSGSSAHNFTFYMCYGNSGVSSYIGYSTAAWNSNYLAVYHFSDNDGTHNILDHTADSNNAWNTGTNTAQGVSGVIGRAMSYDGSTQMSSITQHVGLPFYGTSGFTVSTWIKANSGGNKGYIFEVGNPGAFFWEFGSNPAFYYFIRNDAGSSLSVNGGTNVYDNTWHHVVVTDNNGAAFMYVDGNVTSNLSYTPSGTYTRITDSFGCGWRAGSLLNCLASNIDEVEYFNTALSSGTVQTIYNSQSAPQTFVSIGPETSEGGGGSTPSNTTRRVLIVE